MKTSFTITAQLSDRLNEALDRPRARETLDEHIMRHSERLADVLHAVMDIEALALEDFAKEYLAVIIQVKVIDEKEEGA